LRWFTASTFSGKQPKTPTELRSQSLSILDAPLSTLARCRACIIEHCKLDEIALKGSAMTQRSPLARRARLQAASPRRDRARRRGDRVRRREFISLLGGAAAATWPGFVSAQQSAVPVVGLLRTGTVANLPQDRVTAFRQGLKESGFVEGQNVAIEYRSDENQTERLPLLVADLLRRQVALIVGDTPAALAAKAATTMVPIVFVTGLDPVRRGLVTSLNRPGGNVTGVSFVSVDLAAKQLGLLRELRPGAARIAVLVDSKFPTTESFVSEVRAAASAMGQQIEVLYVSSDREIETAFATLVQRGAGALLGGVGGFLLSQRERIVALAARHRIPAIHVSRDYVAAGGLMSYAPDRADAFRQAGIYAGRILKGEKPGDLPVILPTKFELVINLKTAKALGLEIPDKLLALTDEVIE
jgi:putative ABC transport system substrate-binding protein